jgi:hypothetical protein
MSVRTILSGCRCSIHLGLAGCHDRVTKTIAPFGPSAVIVRCGKSPGLSRYGIVDAQLAIWTQRTQPGVATRASPTYQPG